MVNLFINITSMNKYPVYKSSPNCRFLLGEKGQKLLITVGLNPSTANQEKSDNTITKVKRVVGDNGFDSFLMINLYPARKTKFNDLPKCENEKVMNENLKIIKNHLKTKKYKSITLWAAWGTNIKKRKYLAESLKKLKPIFGNAEWKHFGNLTKEKHPRHPSRLSYNWKFSNFNINDYVKSLS